MSAQVGHAHMWYASLVEEYGESAVGCGPTCQIAQAAAQARWDGICRHRHRESLSDRLRARNGDWYYDPTVAWKVARMQEELEAAEAREPFEPSGLEWESDSDWKMGLFASDQLFLNGSRDDDSYFSISAHPTADHGEYTCPILALRPEAHRLLRLLRMAGVEVQSVEHEGLIHARVLDPRNFHLLWERPDLIVEEPAGSPPEFHYIG